MTPDPWGIDIAYNDGWWGAASEATRATMLEAMGATPDSPPPDPDCVHVVYPGNGAWHTPGELRLDDGASLRVSDSLPPDLPLGYHRFRADATGRESLVIATPGRCLLPDRPTWGWGAQLYAARSEQSWGIGDLADLRALSEWSAELGASTLLINPLGASAPLEPQEDSPYFPCSRRFFNPLYLRVEDVPGAGELGELIGPLARAGRALNAERRIDRTAVFRLKQQALAAIFERFGGDEAFDRFRREQEPALREFAVYCVLAKRHGPNWRDWPAEFRDPRSPEIGRFAEANAREVMYHEWLQWHLDRQLAHAAEPIGLVQDLPVGVHPDGADAWAWQGLLARNCNVGAPPDVFNSNGQDWGVPAFVPHRLREAGYDAFIQTVRAALRYSRGLRIDHVMGLFRLFWIPLGQGPRHGAYVRYRPDEMLAIVALESHRAGAFIVGEDLGNVEPGVRERLAEQNILSYRLLWFEDRAPAEYPHLALAAVTTHDLPTIAGMWTGSDLEDQRRLGMAADEPMARMRHQHARWVQLEPNASLESVIEKTYQILAQSPCLVLAAGLDDALAIPERPNMPGTTHQWPNWRLALPGGLAALKNSELAKKIAQALKR